MNRAGIFNRKELRELKGSAKIRYIWDYYKLPLFLLFIVIYTVSYLIWRGATADFPQLYLAYVNVEAGSVLDQQLTEGFIEYLQPDEKNSVVKTLQNLVLTENLRETDGAYIHASQVKILSAIDNQQLDVVLMNREAFDAFSQNGLLIDLGNFIKDHDLSSLEPYLVENIEILSDNADEVIADPSVEYRSETKSYPMGLEADRFTFFKEAGFSDHVYLGVIANTPRADNVAAFLSYLG